MTIDTTATEPPRNWFLEIAGTPTEDLLRHAEDLRAKLAHAQERGLRVDARAYELRILDVERAIAVHNRRATEAEDQGAAACGGLDPALCRQMADRLRAMWMPAVADQLTAAAELADSHVDLTERHERAARAVNALQVERDALRAQLAEFRTVADRLADVTVGAAESPDLALAEYRRLATGSEPKAIRAQPALTADEVRQTAIAVVSARLAKTSLAGLVPSQFGLLVQEIAGALAENLAGSAVAEMDATDRASLEWAREFIDVHAMPDNAAAGSMLGLIDRLLVECAFDQEQREADLREAFLTGWLRGENSVYEGEGVKPVSAPTSLIAEPAAAEYARSKAGA